MLARLLQRLVDFVLGPTAPDPVLVQQDERNIEAAETVTEVTPTFPQLEPPDIPGTRITAGDTREVIICIDLGTSASAVAHMEGTGHIELARYYTEDAAGNPTTANLIESDAAFPRPEHADAIGPAVLGPVAVALAARGDPSYDHYRSLKRMLTDTPRTDAQNAYYSAENKLIPRIAAMVEELLLLAVLPGHSGTLAQVRRRSPQRAERILTATGFEDHRQIAGRIARGSIRLTVSIPNAFGNFEELIIRRASEQGASRVAARCAGLISEEERGDGAVQVNLMREAEAVVWWTQSLAPPPDSEENWMVFDVGGGSTDSAIVTVRTRAGRTNVRLQMHSGAPFAGGDLDVLCLRLAAESAGDTTEAAITQRILAERGSRVHLMGVFSKIKIGWSKQLVAWLEELNAEERNAFFVWVTDAYAGPEALDPLWNAEGFPDLRVVGTPWLSNRVAPREFAAAWARFLRGLVVGLVAALREQTEAAGGRMQLDRVIISGRGSQIAGVRSLLVRELLRHGWINDPSRVDFVPGGNTSDREHLKLACVRGIAIGAVRAPMEGTVSQHLSDEVTFSVGARPTPLWPRRLPLVGSTARGALLLRYDHDAWENTTIIHFYQARCPPQVVAAIGDASSGWAHRHLGYIALEMRRDVELVVLFHTETWVLRIWDRATISDAEGVELQARSQGSARVTNPLTGLCFGWENQANT